MSRERSEVMLCIATDMAAEAIRAEWHGAWDSSETLSNRAIEFYMESRHEGRMHADWPRADDWYDMLRDGLWTSWNSRSVRDGARR